MPPFPWPAGRALPFMHQCKRGLGFISSENGIGSPGVAQLGRDWAGTGAQVHQVLKPQPAFLLSQAVWGPGPGTHTWTLAVLDLQKSSQM